MLYQLQAAKACRHVSEVLTNDLTTIKKAKAFQSSTNNNENKTSPADIVLKQN